MDSDRSSGFLEDALVDGITTPRSSINNESRRFEVGSSSGSNNNLRQEFAPANNQMAIIEPLLAPANSNNNNRPLSSDSSSSIELSEPDSLEFESDMDIGDSTVTNPHTLIRTLAINDQDHTIPVARLRNGMVIREANVGQESQNVTVNRDGQIVHNNEATLHHFGTLLCPALSEAAQYNNALAGPTPGSYGELLRSMAGNQWSHNNLNHLFQQPSVTFRGFQPFALPNPPLLGNHTLNPYLPIFSVGMSSRVIQPNRQTNEQQEQPFHPNQNCYNNLQHNNLSIQPLELFSLRAGISNHPNGGENNNFIFNGISQNAFPHNTIIPNGGPIPSHLNLSTFNFTRLMSACDLMTSSFSEYWIKRQLTDNLQQHHLNQFGPLANNNVVYNTNSVSLSVPNIPSANPAQPRHNHPPPANTMVGHNPHQAERVPIYFNDVPRRRRSPVQRPAILSRSQLGFNLRRSTSTEVSDTHVVNSVPQDGGNRSNRVAIRERVNLGGRMVNPVRLPHVGHRYDQPRESSASSSKRPRTEILAASLEPIVPQIPRANANWASQSEENSNDVDQNSDGSSIESDVETPGIPNSLYDPAYARMGLPVDPFLRLFAKSKWNKKEHK